MDEIWKDIQGYEGCYQEGKFTQSEIGRMFNVSRTTVSFILSNKRWKHI